MSTTYHCDHCDDVIECPGSNNHKITTESQGIYGFNKNHYDLCYTCFEKVDDIIQKSLFINREKNKGKKHGKK